MQLIVYALEVHRLRHRKEKGNLNRGQAISKQKLKGRLNQEAYT